MQEASVTTLEAHESNVEFESCMISGRSGCIYNKESAALWEQNGQATVVRDYGVSAVKRLLD
jgi:hypothetical protein